MINYARQNQENGPALPPAAEEHIAPAPRVSVQAFCETVETAASVQAAGEDRRLAKAHLKIQMGGLAAAIEAYRTAPTPNVIVLETEGRNDVLGGLDQLAGVCDAGTRVVVIGRVNDVSLYRELVRRGVSDYLIAPVAPLDVVRSICGLFSVPEAKIGSGSTNSLTVPSIKTRRAETTLEIPSGGSMAMAGLIQEQTKQAINGLPGLGQLPVLGALFRSRDYVNRQTELMVLVTPYVVRAVAQKDLSRPDDGFAEQSDPQSVLLGNINRIYGVPARADAARNYSGKYGFITD